MGIHIARISPEQLTKQNVKALEVVLLLPGGKKRKRQFSTEKQASDYLKVTHATEAPLSMRYADGSVIPGRALDRLFRRVFES